MIKKSYVTIMILSILLGLTACGQQTAGSEEIELLEPVGAAVAAESVRYRNIYDAETYETTVIPYVEEYAFSNSSEIEKFSAFPGEKVMAGDILVSSDTKKIDEAIEALEEKIATMKEEYLAYKQDVEEALIEPRGERDRLLDILEKYEEGDPEYTIYNGKYLKQDLDICVQEAALRQKTELYELDYAYYLENLNDLKEERELCILQSETDGEIVAIGQTDYGTYSVKADEGVIAVGDTSRKLLKCDYIQKSVIEKAEEVYAFVNGQKYAVEYQPMDYREYVKLTDSGETVYTTFEIAGDTTDIQVGDYAVVIVVNKSRENVLTVPKDALNRDSLGQFVYVLEDGISVRRDVKSGMSDGVYTEILSGLSEGELVMAQPALSHGSGEAVVEQGRVSTVFQGESYMYYPAITDVNNPIVYGTTRHIETNVKLYQRVEKGDVIATITVEADEIALQRNQLKLQRLQERLQDIVDEGKPEENADTIARRQEEIAELNELINEMQKDARTTEITAPVSGIVVSLEYFTPEQVLKSDCAVAQIADASTCYIMVKNTNQELQYGNEVTIGYQNNKKEVCTVGGTVVNLSKSGVTNDLYTEYSFILIPEEESAALALAIANESRPRCAILAEVNVMENVLVVPREAVTMLAGRTYVHVINENGEIEARSFIAGGYDTSNYWVVDGLTEGMKVCSE